MTWRYKWRIGAGTRKMNRVSKKMMKREINKRMKMRI